MKKNTAHQLLEAGLPLFGKNYSCETHKEPIIKWYDCQKFEHIAKHCRGICCYHNYGKNHQAIKHCNNRPHYNKCNKQGHPSSTRNYTMKFFQFNINSIITSLDELRKYQNKNNYDGIFLRETNYTDSKPLDNFKYWKSEMHAI